MITSIFLLIYTRGFKCPFRILSFLIDLTLRNERIAFLAEYSSIFATEEINALL